MRKALIAFFLSSASAMAGDVALVIGNQDYRHGRDASGATELLDAFQPLRNAGFQVFGGRNLDARTQRQVLDQFAAQVDGSGRIVVALAGRFAHVAGHGYLLATDTREVTPGALAMGGVSIAQLSALAGRAPGGAVVIVAPRNLQADKTSKSGPGTGQLTAAQGVTVVEGSIGDMADFLRIAIPQRGLSVKEMLKDWPEAKAQGFLSDLVAFRAAERRAAVTPVDPDRDEKALWRATQSIGTAAAYRNYVERYPRGLFAEDARREISRIAAQPLLRAERTEKNLGLNRDARRQIQRNLSLLDFDTRGIDGIFGPGSRRAINSWQTRNGEEATGYLTRGQIGRLQSQADQRAAELEQEARRKQEQLEAQDRIYWESTGRLGDEAGLRAYLERYPEGLFSDLAKARLEPFDAARRAEAEAQDRADWDAVRANGSLAAYRSYVQAHPDGAFVADANAKIEELEFEERNAGALAAAERNERQLGLNDGTRKLVESRLAKLKLEPGPIDGVFDRDTRRAIRRYQEARNLQRTGFLNQATLVRLLADAVFR